EPRLRRKPRVRRAENRNGRGFETTACERVMCRDDGRRHGVLIFLTFGRYLVQKSFELKNEWGGGREILGVGNRPRCNEVLGGDARGWTGGFRRQVRGGQRKGDRVAQRSRATEKRIPDEECDGRHADCPSDDRPEWQRRHLGAKTTAAEGILL